MAEQLQGADEDDDEELMAEELRDRVEDFLRENDVLYAVNAFLANADDTILLDRLFFFRTLMLFSPAFETLQSSSYIIIFYNDVVLSRLEFSSLRKVGIKQSVKIVSGFPVVFAGFLVSENLERKVIRKII